MIVNTWDQNHADGGDRIVIYYRPAGKWRSSSWQVGRMKKGREIKTDPKAHWEDRGCKTFDIGGAIRIEKEPKLREAIAWANKTSACASSSAIGWATTSRGKSTSGSRFRRRNGRCRNEGTWEGSQAHATRMAWVPGGLRLLQRTRRAVRCMLCEGPQSTPDAASCLAMALRDVQAL